MILVFTAFILTLVVDLHAEGFLFLDLNHHPLLTVQQVFELQFDRNGCQSKSLEL